MTQVEYEVYDFRQASAADDSAVAFQSWTGKASQVFNELWMEYSNFEASMTGRDIRTQSFNSALADVPISNICCTFTIGEMKSESIWHATQSDIRLVVADLLDMAESANLEERPLTELELVLAKAFFELLAKTLMIGWLGNSPLSCEVNEVLVNPKRVKICRGKDLVVNGGLTIKLARGEVNVGWISTKQEIAELLSMISERRSSLPTGNRPEQIVQTLPLEVVGILGQTSIPMKTLSKIAVGDLIRLNQRIDRPIVATVEGRAFFECWPGKIGETVALEVGKCLVPMTETLPVGNP